LVSLVPVVASNFVAFGEAGREAHDYNAATFSPPRDHNSFSHDKSESGDAARDENKVEDVHELRTKVAIEFLLIRMCRECSDFFSRPRLMSLCTLAGERLSSAPASFKV